MTLRLSPSLTLSLSLARSSTQVKSEIVSLVATTSRIFGELSLELGQSSGRV